MQVDGTAKLWHLHDLMQQPKGAKEGQAASGPGGEGKSQHHLSLHHHLHHGSHGKEQQAEEQQGAVEHAVCLQVSTLASRWRSTRSHLSSICPSCQLAPSHLRKPTRILTMWPLPDKRLPSSTPPFHSFLIPSCIPAQTYEHPDFVTSVAFHPHDARRFATGCADGRVRVWGTLEGRVLASASLQQVRRSV